ncbi:MAG: PQQ-binding-like beta-propeller repeat protein [Thermoanaerobaculia bacterium]
MKKIRWWPAAVILALALIALGYVWLSDQGQRQDRNVGTIIVVGLTIALLTLWLLLLSRLPGKLRLGILAALMLLVLALRLTVRIKGVSGDWIPQLAWRWSAGPQDLEDRTADAAAIATVSAAPEDFPQFLGLERNGKVRGVRLARDWENQPPRLMWRREVGPAWSGFAVAGGVAVTQEQQDGEEVVAAYELRSGEPLWSTGAAGRFETTIGGTGPRATPTIDDGRVFTMGALGLLSCLDLATGEALWSRNVVEENRSGMPQWGKSGSPLVFDGLVVVTAGGDGQALIAYDRETGEERWRGGDDRSSYSSPFVTELAGAPQIVIFNAASVAGHDPGDGSVLWQHPWPSEAQPCVAQPLPLGDDRLLVSSGYGVGAKLFQIRDGGSGLEAEMVWESRRLKAKFSQMVEHGGAVYGLDDGIMVCLDPATGERCWKRGRYGHGQILLIEDLLLVQSERGDIVLVEPAPDELRELGSFAALDGKAWNTMALSGPYLLVRTAEEAACYQLPLAS